jgi:chromosomal replication initiation ATPase DnaA
MIPLKDRVARLEGRMARVEHVVVKEQTVSDPESFHGLLHQIKLLVCEHFHVTLMELESRARPERIVKARQAAMYLCRRHCVDASLKEIGRSFGRGDSTTNPHSGVHHAVGAAVARIAQDHKYAALVNEVSKVIGGGK